MTADSGLRAMLDGCRENWDVPERFLILADYIDDYIGDTDWSSLIRLSVEFPPTGRGVRYRRGENGTQGPPTGDWHPDLGDTFDRMAARFNQWPSRFTTNGLWMWTDNPWTHPWAMTSMWWKHGVVYKVFTESVRAAVELMQPGFLDTCE